MSGREACAAAAAWRCEQHFGASWLCSRIQGTRYIFGRKRSMVALMNPLFQGSPGRTREEDTIDGGAAMTSRIGDCRLVHSQQQAIPTPRHRAVSLTSPDQELGAAIAQLRLVCHACRSLIARGATQAGVSALYSVTLRHLHSVMVRQERRRRNGQDRRRIGTNAERRTNLLADLCRAMASMSNVADAGEWDGSCCTCFSCVPSVLLGFAVLLWLAFAFHFHLPPLKKRKRVRVARARRINHRP